MIGQKEAVLKAVNAMLPGFIPKKDIALVMLTNVQLEQLKKQIGEGLYNGTIEYGKTDKSEVYAYARSMVMNHLKKSRELNGNQEYSSSGAAKPDPAVKALASIDQTLLSEDLANFVKTLV